MSGAPVSAHITPMQDRTTYTRLRMSRFLRMVCAGRNASNVVVFLLRDVYGEQQACICVLHELSVWPLLIFIGRCLTELLVVVRARLLLRVL